MVLGTIFVVLDLIANIYWLGQDQAWVWWVSIMVLGLGVILLFSYFERLSAILRDVGDRGEDSE